MRLLLFITGILLTQIHLLGAQTCGGPSDFRARALTSSSLILSWQDNGLSAPYTIYFRESGDPVFDEVDNVQSENFILNNLTQGVVYEICVEGSGCAVSGDGISERSCLIAQTQFGDRALDTDNISVSGTQEVCAAEQTSGSLALANLGGASVLQWESSTDGFRTLNVISNQTNVLAFTSLNQTTQFRALLRNGLLVGYAGPYIVTVHAASAGGAVSGGTQNCSGSATGQLLLSGQTGSVVRWEFSRDNFVSDIQTLNNQSVVQAYNETQTTQFRAVVQNGNCPEAFSATDEVAIVSPPNAGVLLGSSTKCEGAASGQLVLSGYNGKIEFWESSTDNFQTTRTTLSNDLPFLTYSNLNQTTWYRAAVSGDPLCPLAFSTTALVAVGGPLRGGNIAPETVTVCANANNGVLQLSNFAGNIVRWEGSVDGFRTITPIANNTPSLSYTNITQETQYRAVLEQPGCGQVFSTTATISPADGFQPGEAAPDTVVCSDKPFGTIRLEDYTGTIVQWEQSTDGFATVDTIQDGTPEIEFEDLTETTEYRALVRTLQCPGAYSLSAQVIVVESTIGGDMFFENSQSNDTTICSGNPITIEVRGSRGAVLQWEVSEDNFATVDTLNVTDTVFTFTDPQSSFRARALLLNNTCEPKYSEPARVDVEPQAEGGTILRDTSVCPGANNGELTLEDFSGDIVHWEYSDDDWSTIDTVLNATPLITFANLTQTTRYRVLVTNTNGNCPDYSDTATVTVSDQSVTGTIFQDTTVCPGSNTGLLTLENYNGVVLLWEASVDNFANLDTVETLADSHTFLDLGDDTQYRALVESPGCVPTYSPPITVTVDSLGLIGGTATGDTIVCAGSNSGEIMLINSLGPVTRWEASTDGFVNDVQIINNSSNSIFFTNISETTQYRARISASGCATRFSSPATVTVDPNPFDRGTVSADLTVCEDGNSPMVSVTGYEGVILRWETSTDDFASINSIPFNTDTITLSNLTEDTDVRAALKVGSCPEAFSDTVNIKVSESVRGGFIVGPTVVCSGRNAGPLVLTDRIGAVVRWEQSLDDFATDVTVPLNSTPAPVYAYQDIADTTFYRVYLTNGACEGYSDTLQIDAAPDVNPGRLTGIETVCSGDNAGELNLVDFDGRILRWEATDLSGPGSGATKIINNLDSDYQFENLSVSTQYVVVLDNEHCPETRSQTATIAVTNCQPCISPNEVVVADILNNTVNLEWEDVPNTLGYEVTYRQQGSGVWNQFTINRSFAEIAPLNACSNYEFRVRSVCSRERRSEFLDTLELTTITDICRAPEDLVVSNISQTSATVTWQSFGCAEDYIVFYRDVNSGQGFSTATTTNNSFELTGLAPEGEYEVYVKANCDNGVRSPQSGLIRFNTSLDNCTAPANLIVDNLTASEATLRWDPVSGSTGYTVEWRIKDRVFTRENTLFTSFTLPLDTNEVYEFRVRTRCDRTLNSAFTSIIEFTSTATCYAPTALEVLSTSFNSGTLTWVGDATNVVNYEVVYSIVGSGDEDTILVDENLATIPLLQPNENYEVKVRSICAGGFSEYSYSVTFSTEPPCESPRIFDLQTTPTQTTIQWVPVVTSQGYEVCWRLDIPGERCVTFTLTDPLLNKHTFADAIPNLYYEVEVRALCANGVKSEPDSRVFQVPAPRKGLAEAASVSNLHIYPNPNRGRFTLSLDAPAAATAEARLTSLSGQKVWREQLTLREGANKIVAAPEGLAAGVYFVEIELNGTIQRAKVVVE